MPLFPFILSGKRREIQKSEKNLYTGTTDHGRSQKTLPPTKTTGRVP